MAVAFFEVWDGRGAVLDELQSLLSEAEAALPLEAEAALKIQRLFRGQTVRALVQRWRDAAGFIQRVFRGHMGRLRSHAARAEVLRVERLAVFHYHTLAVQKTFRGYYSRRYYHDFYARQAYLSEVVRTSEALREQLVSVRATQAAAAEDAAARRTEDEFREVTQNLHHLVSTAAQPGIFNNPFLPADAVPSAFGAPLEVHLRTGVKDLLRERARAAAAAGQPRTAPPPPLDYGNRLSVQATSKYGVDAEAERLREGESKRARLDSLPFSAGGTAPALDVYRDSVDKGVTYLDKWKNPYAARGVPQSAADLDPEVTTLGKFPVVPFFTRVGGNKSTALPNDRFDVMTQPSVTEVALERSGRTAMQMQQSTRGGPPQSLLLQTVGQQSLVQPGSLASKED